MNVCIKFFSVRDNNSQIIQRGIDIMKKIYVFLVVTVVLLSLTGCNTNDRKSNTTDEANPTPTTEASATDNNGGTGDDNSTTGTDNNDATDDTTGTDNNNGTDGTTGTDDTTDNNDGVT